MAENIRFRIACRYLRGQGLLNKGRKVVGGGKDAVFHNYLPGQRRGESPIDWLVRLGVAVDAENAALALIQAAGKMEEFTALLEMCMKIEVEEGKLKVVQCAVTGYNES